MTYPPPGTIVMKRMRKGSANSATPPVFCIVVPSKSQSSLVYSQLIMVSCQTDLRTPKFDRRNSQIIPRGRLQCRKTDYHPPITVHRSPTKIPPRGILIKRVTAHAKRTNPSLTFRKHASRVMPSRFPTLNHLSSPNMKLRG
jgi:hypothetical protein